MRVYGVREHIVVSNKEGRRERIQMANLIRVGLRRR